MAFWHGERTHLCAALIIPYIREQKSRDLRHKRAVSPGPGWHQAPQSLWAPPSARAPASPVTAALSTLTASALAQCSASLPWGGPGLWLQPHPLAGLCCSPGGLLIPAQEPGYRPKAAQFCLQTSFLLTSWPDIEPALLPSSCVHPRVPEGCKLRKTQVSPPALRDKHCQPSLILRGTTQLGIPTLFATVPWGATPSGEQVQHLCTPRAHTHNPSTAAVSAERASTLKCACIFHSQPRSNSRPCAAPALRQHPSLMGLEKA